MSRPEGMSPIPVSGRAYIDAQRDERANGMKKRGEEEKLETRWTINKNLIKQRGALDLRNVHHVIQERVETILVHNTLVVFLI